MSFFGWGKEEDKPKPRTRPGASKKKAVRKASSNKPTGITAAPQKTEEELFDTIEANFFTQMEFDPLEPIIENLSDETTPKEILAMIAQREAQLELINARLYDNVINNYGNFVQGMVQIRELGVDLETSVRLCRNGRSLLRKTDRELIAAPVNIISNNRKRILYQRVLDILQNIKVIQGTEQQLRDLLTDGDFPAAIQLCQSFNEEVNKNQEFTCIQELTKDIKRLENLVQQKLDDSLLEVTRTFSSSRYESLLRAYLLSGKLHRVTTKLKASFEDSVIAGSKDLLYAHVLISDDNAGKAELLKTLPFAKLTTKLAEENFMACLQRIFEFLVELMHAHYQMRDWHMQSEQNADEGDMEREYKDVRIGLERVSKSIWDQMQRNIVLLLENSRLSSFKIEPLLAVLDAVSKLIEFGEEFSGEPATQLHGCLLKQSRNYFQNYHRKKLEDLKTMVENERWEAMPVHAGYGPEDIKEIRHFVHAGSCENQKGSLTSMTGGSRSILQRNVSRQGDVSALASLSSTGNPFSEKMALRRDQESDDEDEELKQEYVKEEGVIEDEKRKESETLENELEVGNGASVTIVCLNLVRYIGNYLQMMKILQPIAYEVFVGVEQLYQYYLYIVFHFFSTKPTSSQTGSLVNQTTTSFNSIFQRNSTTEVDPSLPHSFIDDITEPKLKKIFQEINRTLFVQPVSEKPFSSFSLLEPTISTEIDIHSSNSMYGLKNRTVALESLEFLAHCFHCVKSQVLLLLPNNYSELCNKFYGEFVEIVPLVRDVIMESMSERLVNVANIPGAVERLKWNVGEMDFGKNQYVKDLIKEFHFLVNVKLQQVVFQGIVSRPEKNFLLKKCVALAMEQLIEGFSRVKKCSNEGRAQMSMDVVNFTTEMKKLAPHIQPLPHQQRLEMYIKAFYSQDIKEWIVENQDDYTGKQLLGLAVCTGGNMPRKEKNELFRVVDEICLKKKN